MSHQRWKLLEKMPHHLQPVMGTVQVKVVAVEDKQGWGMRL